MQLMNIRYKCIRNFNKMDFYNIILDWVYNTEDLRYKMSFDELPFDGFKVYRDGKKELTIIECNEVNVIAALHTDVDLYGVEWFLSIVFKQDNHEIFIRMCNSVTTEIGKFMQNFRKPDIIDELVDLNILEMDCNIPISFEYQDVSKGNIDCFISVLNRTSNFKLPVIYISVGPYNMYGVDPMEIADVYAGMAHVFCQDHRDCFDDMILKTNNYVPRNGEVAIYYPGDNLKESHFAFNKYDEKSMKSLISKAIHFYYHNQNYGPMTTYEEIASKAMEIRNNHLKIENNQISLENVRVKKENIDIVSTFDEDLKRNGVEIDKLRQRNIKLERENSILKNILISEEKLPVLYYGNELELYPGEIKELLIDVLKNNTTVQENSRRSHIVKDLVRTNDTDVTIKERHRKLKEVLSGYKYMTNDIKAELEKIGFAITSVGKHHKLVYHSDERYQFSISKTSSDYRAGLNASADIIKNMM